MLHNAIEFYIVHQKSTVVLKQDDGSILPYERNNIHEINQIYLREQSAARPGGIFFISVDR